MNLPKLWLILTITILLASQVLGANLDVFFRKAEQYQVDPLAAAAIIKCESGGYPHAIHKNVDNSIDIGLFQINDSHLKEAAARGNNLSTVEGNLDYGFYLASKQGFRPWIASNKCIGNTINAAGSNTS